MNLSKLSFGQLANISLAVLLFLSIAFTTYNIRNLNSYNAEAAKGGGGKTKITYSGTCSVAPNPAAVGTDITISGSGFPANAGLGIVVSGSGGTQMGFALADNSGNVSTTWSATWLGTNSVAIQSNTRQVIGAVCSFQVL